MTTIFMEGNSATPSGDNIGGKSGEYYYGKAYTPPNELTEGRTKYGANNNVRVFRYADMLLMNAETLKFYNSNLDYVCEPGDFQVMVGPNSRDVQKLGFTL